jgi:hypothetical protein
MYPMKKLLFFGFLFLSLAGTAMEEIPTPFVTPIDGIEISENWTEYTTVDGIKIEYKMTLCESEKMRAQNLLLFRFTNTTDQEVTVSWRAKEFRNGECWNCANLYDEEYMNSLTLSAGQSIEGQGASTENRGLNIFGNFVKLVPGMTDQSLTNFELVDLTVR